MQIDGKPVVDPKRGIILEINAKDVSTGRKREANSCAAAKACVRQLGAMSARVHASRVYVEFDKKWVRFHTPPALRTEIVSFDRGHRFETGEYTLNPLPPTKKASGRRQGSDAPKTRRTKRAKYHVVSGIRSHATGWKTSANA